jgi:hypothetical protein
MATPRVCKQGATSACVRNRRFGASEAQRLGEAGVLDHPARSARLNEGQIVELSVVRELHDLLGARDAALIWLEVRGAFRKHADSAHLDFVVDIGYREATLVLSPEDLGEACEHLGQ